jgi:hypothetical protein
MGNCRSEKLLQYTNLALEVVSDMQLQGARHGQRTTVFRNTRNNSLGSRDEQSG